MSVPSGQPVRLTFKTYSDADKTTLADPTALTLYVKTADGTITPYTWASAAVTKDSTGTFHYDLSGTGLVGFRWEATGAVATSSPAGYIYFWDDFPAALVGLDDVKAHLTILATDTSNDDELQNFIYAASALLLSHPGYRIADAAQSNVYTERVNGLGDRLILKHYPILDVDSVTQYVGGVAQVFANEPLADGSFTGYGWDYDDGTGANGMLVRSPGAASENWCGTFVVVYTAGAASVPAEIRLAALDLTAHLWETQRGGATGLPTGSDIPDDAAFGASFRTTYALPNRVIELLAAYVKTSAVA